MKENLRPKVDQPEVKSKFTYYISIILNVISYDMTLVPGFFLNIYYDTITNEQNNNWDVEIRKNNLSKLSLFHNLGGLVGILVGLVVSKLNPMVVLNLSRFMLAISVICLAVPDITIMALSRFFTNLFGCLCQVTVIWTAYELYRSEDQAKIMVALSLAVPIFNFSISLSSKFDPGNEWYWRQVLAIIPFTLVLSVFIDLFCIKRLNSVSYLLREHGRETAFQQLNNVFSEEYTEELVQRFEMELQNEKKEKEKLEQKGFSQWSMDLMVYKYPFINLQLITLLALTGFQIQYMGDGLLIGSKVLSDSQATQSTKTAMTLETIAELITYILAIVFSLTQKRKRSLLVCMFFACLILFSSSLGYLIQDLRVVRFGLVLLGVSYGFYFPALHLYTNDLVPASLVPSQVLCIIAMNTVADPLFPLFFDFENSSYESIGLKFAFLTLIGVVSMGVVFCLMIETDGLTRDQVRIQLNNRWGGGKRTENGFVELQTEETHPSKVSEKIK